MTVQRKMYSSRAVRRQCLARQGRLSGKPTGIGSWPTPVGRSLVVVGGQSMAVGGEPQHLASYRKRLAAKAKLRPASRVGKGNRGWPHDFHWPYPRNHDMRRTTPRELNLRPQPCPVCQPGITGILRQGGVEKKE